MSFLVTWVVLAGFWWGLSGKADATHLVFGAVSVTLVSALSHRHLTANATVRLGLARTVRTILYLPWLFWQIFVANIDVLLRVIGVRPIDPKMIRFRPELDSDYGLTLLANSITLTPGTVTVEVDNGEMIVHALTPGAADGVMSKAMEERVHRVEGEGGNREDDD